MSCGALDQVVLVLARLQALHDERAELCEQLAAAPMKHADVMLRDLFTRQVNRRRAGHLLPSRAGADRRQPGAVAESLFRD